MLSAVKFSISAPGKVILFGEHGVLYGKPALAASISKRTSLEFETIFSDNIDLEFFNLDWKINIPMEYICKFDSSSVNPKETCERAADDVAYFNINENLSTSKKMSLHCFFFLLRALFSNKKISRAFKITISSELSMGAGTGSSASFTVCLSAALYQYCRILESIGNEDTEDLHQFSSKDKETINEWAFICEQIIHGKASGIDNYVCTHGSVVEMRFNKIVGNKEMKVLTNAPKLRILLINTGVSRNTSILVKKVEDLRVNNRDIIDNILNAMEEVVNKACVVLERLNICNVETPENRKSFLRLEELISLNQGLLWSIGVSHESLDSVVNITRKFNFHSKLTGAGGGGYAITIIPPDSSEHRIQNCVEMLQNNGYTVDDLIVGDKGVNIQIQDPEFVEAVGNKPEEKWHWCGGNRHMYYISI